MPQLLKNKANFGTAPVFLTAISTILGAVMFLRFGYAVGSVGFLWTLAIIVIGHLITVPTAMAIAEIATNQKVEGGGEYFIISRSFGLNIGGAIGLALYLSQAISVAFYIIAFAEAFSPVYEFVNNEFGLSLSDKRLISIPALGILSLIMLTKGADLGVKALYLVAGILLVSLLFFFGGSTSYAQITDFDLTGTVSNPDNFFYVFAIVFPAFTGMTAGVGLSGDLKNPKRSIPLGTMSATILGMAVYVLIAYKLAATASPDDLVGDQLIMGTIAIWGPIIPIGLAAATISSALGSIMVAPRTLQAIAADGIFPTSVLNRVLAKGTIKNNEPKNATIVSLIVAFLFVSIGDVNAVAEIISMFFMVTYGAICLISFLQHFAADPSYRPTFKSKWSISLIGAVMCIYLMFKMNPAYALSSIVIMVVIYMGITKYVDNKQGMAKIFQGVIFQLSRQLQVFIQKAEKDSDNWRPSVICITRDSFKRLSAFDLMRFITFRYGFGSYLHLIDGYISTQTHKLAKEELSRLIKMADVSHSNVYVDTIISPSYTTAVAQSVQLPSVSGKDSNMMLFEYNRKEAEALKEIIENLSLVKAGEFDICILSTADKGFAYKSEIHIWITQNDFENANLMILLGYVIMGHPEWQRAQIKIFAAMPEAEMADQQERMIKLINEGRLPISANNIELITISPEVNLKEIINTKSCDADLTLIGFKTELVKQLEDHAFEGFDEMGNVLFINAHKETEIISKD
ncbi:MAG: amino acid permease [Bacteroidetes bacterium]|nr:amino acid permease [Bacteroidota bacterium]MDA1119745.1 amino acid permease [Bacteroidota bacterium]